MFPRANTKIFSDKWFKYTEFYTLIKCQSKRVIKGGMGKTLLNSKGRRWCNCYLKGEVCWHDYTNIFSMQIYTADRGGGIKACNYTIDFIRNSNIDTKTIN